MTIDWQTFLNLCAGAVVTVIGWFARELWKAVQDLKDSIHDIEVELPSRYVRKDEFSDALRDIKEMLNKINDKLDDKMDKH
jgi:hypothetical protein